MHPDREHSVDPNGRNLTCKKLQASFCSGCLGLFCGVIVALQGFSGGRSSTSGAVASQGLSLASPVVWLDSSEASLSGFPPEPGGSGGRRRGKGENAVFAAGGNEVSGLCLDAVQRFFDETQHKLPLGVLPAGPLGFSLQAVNRLDYSFDLFLALCGFV